MDSYADDLDILKDFTQFKFILLKVLEIKLRNIDFMNITSIRVIKTDDLTPDVQISNAVDLSKQFSF